MPDTGVIDRYLADLDRAMRATPRLRARIHAEVADHLLDAAGYEQERGIPAAEAMERAIGRFGPPQVIARQFMADLATSGTRAASGALALLVLSFGALEIITSPVAGRLVGQPANGFFAPPGPWPNDVPPPSLSLTANLSGVTFLAACALMLFALWQTHWHKAGFARSFREIEITISARAMHFVALAATVIGLLALFANGLLRTIFAYQRAAAVPGSPSPRMLAIFALVHAAMLIVGAARGRLITALGYFAAAAAIWLAPAALLAELALGGGALTSRWRGQAPR